MVDFTALERAVFAAISAPPAETGDLRLTQLLASANPKERERSAHGFFTTFAVDVGLPPLSIRRGVIDGPDLLVAAGPHLLQMGFALWVDEAGYPECLEGFQYGSSAGRPLDLEGVELAELAPAGAYVRSA